MASLLVALSLLLVTTVAEELCSDEIINLYLEATNAETAKERYLATWSFRTYADTPIFLDSGEIELEIDGSASALPEICVKKGEYLLEIRRPLGSCEAIANTRCEVPTSKPTSCPSNFPTSRPTGAPITAQPTQQPQITPQPTRRPTRQPTRFPSPRPTFAPTLDPTSAIPTLNPTHSCYSIIQVESGTCTSAGCSVFNFFQTPDQDYRCFLHSTILSAAVSGDVDTGDNTAATLRVASQVFTLPEATILSSCSGNDLNAQQPEGCLGTEYFECPAMLNLDLLNRFPELFQIDTASSTFVIEASGAAETYQDCGDTEPAFRVEATVTFEVCCQAPSTCPTLAPSQMPSTFFPTSSPSEKAQPSFYPSLKPSFNPTTAIPTSGKPTSLPIPKPTQPLPTTSSPTFFPTSPIPTIPPSQLPTLLPSKWPTTLNPSSFPTFVPSTSPTSRPTANPTFLPSIHPTSAPTPLPSSIPTLKPSFAPSLIPTIVPTSRPTIIPTAKPTNLPSLKPTSLLPTLTPSASPSFPPSVSPTPLPTTLSPTITTCFDYEQIQEGMCTSEACEITNRFTISAFDEASCVVSDVLLNIFVSGDFNGDTENGILEEAKVFLDDVQFPASSSCFSTGECLNEDGVSDYANFRIPQYDNCPPYADIDATELFSDGDLLVKIEGTLSVDACRSFARGVLRAHVCCYTPTSLPTTLPIPQPSLLPSSPPTSGTKAPTRNPTTHLPSIQPTLFPSTAKPTKFPTSSPSLGPSSKPTSDPTHFPSPQPTSTDPPSEPPTRSPTRLPTLYPSRTPTVLPTPIPSSGCIDQFRLVVGGDGNAEYCALWSASLDETVQNAHKKKKKNDGLAFPWVYFIWAILCLLGLCICCFLLLPLLAGLCERREARLFPPDVHDPAIRDNRRDLEEKNRLARDKDPPFVPVVPPLAPITHTRNRRQQPPDSYDSSDDGLDRPLSYRLPNDNQEKVSLSYKYDNNPPPEAQLVDHRSNFIPFGPPPRYSSGTDDNDNDHHDSLSLPPLPPPPHENNTNVTTNRNRPLQF